MQEEGEEEEEEQQEEEGQTAAAPQNSAQAKVLKFIPQTTERKTEGNTNITAGISGHFHPVSVRVPYDAVPQIPIGTCPS